MGWLTHCYACLFNIHSMLCSSRIICYGELFGGEVDLVFGLVIGFTSTSSISYSPGLPVLLWILWISVLFFKYYIVSFINTLTTECPTYGVIISYTEIYLDILYG